MSAFQLEMPTKPSTVTSPSKTILPPGLDTLTVPCLEYDPVPPVLPVLEAKYCGPRMRSYKSDDPLLYENYLDDIFKGARLNDSKIQEMFFYSANRSSMLWLTHSHILHLAFFCDHLQ